MTTHHCPRQVAAYPGREQAGHGRGRWLVVTGTTMRMAIDSQKMIWTGGDKQDGMSYPRWY